MFRIRACSAVPISVRLGAAGLVAVLLVGGCSASGDEPEGEGAEQKSTLGATATPTVSPTPAVYKSATAEGPAENVPLPVMPELAKQESREGLEAFLMHWYALINYGFETGNTTPIEEISGSDCVVCRSFYRMVNNGFTDEDWIVGGKIEVLTNHSDFILTTDGLYQVLANIRQDELQYRGPAKSYLWSGWGNWGFNGPNDWSFVYRRSLAGYSCGYDEMTECVTRNRWIVYALALVMIFIKTPAAAAKRSSGGSGRFEDDDVYVGGEYKLPGSVAWGLFDVGIPADPNEYMEYKEVLEAFAVDWFSLVNYGYETGDTSHVRELSGPECEICKSFNVSMENRYIDPDWVQSRTLTISRP